MDRRERTRTALLTAALEMFADRGYDATTTAEIARRAGVTEMTLFRHFPTKASLLVEDPYDPLIAAAVRSRPASEPPLLAVVRGIGNAWTSVPEPEAAAVRERMRIVASTPTLAGAIAAGSRTTEEAIAIALTDRRTPSSESRVVAAAVVAGLNAALLDWALGDDPDLGAALRTAFRALGDIDDQS
ncbi:MAG: TetR/AcrR family transcriptional regulator [Nocardiaceae bacterium]|nr:TetR/AcrR family transcriptional regulator [Nocardiaceae bacterium]